ncbi:hypothetical protein QBC39DRAFT_433780 [Podospora conica]|nr:hypothetical protein QBC39DRAFT_433780 [Schizothecium conicum]
MRTVSFAVIAITLFQSVLAQRGFHLMDRHVSWIYKATTECPKRADCSEVREPFDDDGLWLVPANQFNCNVIRDKNYFEGPRLASEIGSGTTVKGQCGSSSLTFFPINNNQELEVWESNGSRMYGKCYRQEAGKVMNCDSPGDGAGCSHPLVGQPLPNTCKIRATGVWVCPVDLCG